MRPSKDFIDRKLLSQIHFLTQLTTSLRSRLPSSMAEHCWVASYDRDTLCVLTDSSNWTLALRYQQREILKQLNTEFRLELQAPLKRLKVRIAATTPRSTRIPLPRPTLSTANAALIDSVATSISDPELSAALSRLAKRGSSTDQSD